MPALSVVVPVHNEAAFLPAALPALIEAVDSVTTDGEILVVENGSTDGTAAVASELGGEAVRVIQLSTPDYGEAMKTGFELATGDWIVNVDIDYFSADFFASVLASDADLVIGSKRDPDSDDRRPALRRLATAVFNLLLRTMFGSRVSDTHGMKGFRHHVIERFVPETVSRRDLFDTELVLRAERAGVPIEEVPVVVEELRSARSSLLRRVPRTLRGLWTVRRLLG
ncbi:MAG: glycosyltransferase family 2 protein [Acidimicrobiia bacterium]|nr:glycosyltransferase family 2 protein [Acidimicrobiia bacterium]